MNYSCFESLLENKQNWLLRTIESSSFLSRRKLKEEVELDVNMDEVAKVLESCISPKPKKEEVVQFDLPIGIYVKSNIPLIKVKIEKFPTLPITPRSEITNYVMDKLNKLLSKLQNINSLKEIIETYRKEIEQTILLLVLLNKEDLEPLHKFGRKHYTSPTKVFPELSVQEDLFKGLQVDFNHLYNKMVRGDEIIKSRAIPPHLRRFFYVIFNPVFTFPVFKRIYGAGEEKINDVFSPSLEGWKLFMRAVAPLLWGGTQNEKALVWEFVGELFRYTAYTHLGVSISAQMQELRGYQKILVDIVWPYTPMRGTSRFLWAVIKKKRCHNALCGIRKFFGYISSVFEGLFFKHLVFLRANYLGGKSYHYKFSVPSPYTKLSGVIPIGQRRGSVNLKVEEHCFHEYFSWSLPGMQNTQSEGFHYPDVKYLAVVKISKLLSGFFLLGLLLMIALTYLPLYHHFLHGIPLFSSSCFPGTELFKELLKQSVTISCTINSGVSLQNGTNTIVSVIYNLFPWFIFLVVIPFNSYLVEQGLRYIRDGIGVSLGFSFLYTVLRLFSNCVPCWVYLVGLFLHIIVLVGLLFYHKFLLSPQDKIVLNSIKEMREVEVEKRRI